MLPQIIPKSGLFPTVSRPFLEDFNYPGIQSKLKVTNVVSTCLTLLHSEWPKLHRVLTILSAVGLLGVKNRRCTHTLKGYISISVLQIRRGNRDTLGIISHIFP